MRLFVRLLIGSTAALLPALAHAEGGFKLEGTYLRNQQCEGDGSQSEPLLVKITPAEIFYVGGVCSIDERKEEQPTVAMRVTCKFKNGRVLSSNISFTKRDGTTWDMAQQDGSYRAVLHLCPKP